MSERKKSVRIASPGFRDFFLAASLGRCKNLICLGYICTANAHFSFALARLRSRERVTYAFTKIRECDTTIKVVYF